MNKLVIVAICIAFCSVAFADKDATCQTGGTGASDVCTLCKLGYGDASPAAHTCNACTLSTGTNSNCNCDDAGNDACTGCQTDGLGVSKDKKSCVACNDKNCAKCDADYSKCDECNADATGYGRDQTKGTCDACQVANCAVCTDDYTICDECADGYAMDVQGNKQVCTACSKGCKTCDTVDANCDACPGTQVLNKNDTTNEFCCPANCSDCSSMTKCTACQSGFNFNSDKGTCFGFKTGASLTLGAIVSVALFSLLF